MIMRLTRTKIAWSRFVNLRTGISVSGRRNEGRTPQTGGQRRRLRRNYPIRCWWQCGRNPTRIPVAVVVDEEHGTIVSGIMATNSVVERSHWAWTRQSAIAFRITASAESNPLWSTSKDPPPKGPWCTILGTQTAMPAAATTKFDHEDLGQSDSLVIEQIGLLIGFSGHRALVWTLAWPDPQAVRNRLPWYGSRPRN